MYDAKSAGSVFDFLIDVVAHTFHWRRCCMALFLLRLDCCTMASSSCSPREMRASAALRLFKWAFGDTRDSDITHLYMIEAMSVEHKISCTIRNKKRWRVAFLQKVLRTVGPRRGWPNRQLRGWRGCIKASRIKSLFIFPGQIDVFPVPSLHAVNLN